MVPIYTILVNNWYCILYIVIYSSTSAILMYMMYILVNKLCATYCI